MATVKVCDRCLTDSTNDLHTLRLSGDADDVSTIEIELCRGCYCELRQVVGDFIVPDGGGVAARAWWRSFIKEES